MTSLSTAGTQRPPPRSLDTGTVRHFSRSAVQSIPQYSKPIPHQIFVDPDSAAVATGDRSSPVAKRQKTDIGKHFTAGYLGAPIREGTAVLAQQNLQQVTQNESSHPDDIVKIQLGSKSSDKDCLEFPPFPKRPDRNTTSISILRGVSIVSNSTEEAQPKPYCLESSKSAPQFGNNTSADFSPWLGDHLEDLLNEQTTKSGYHDRTQSVNPEFNTARQLVLSSLKHRPGLQVLSSLYASALDQRQLRGTVTANCTFKPPPRVTLTDTKREAWLRDLASPAIPLRRLSRTIPHGIRGKALLEHCLAKGIAIWRAVWLAKCVGANEIRAFRRKGASGAFAVGGEVKWTRDWTVNVEQFIELLLEGCGASGWKARITYGLHLIAHLYSEHLLDHEHFLDWVLTSLRTSDIDRIPIWLLIVQIFWKEIWRYRHRGRRLSEAMLNHLHTVNKLGTTPVYESVRAKLKCFLKSSLLLCPDCFVLPDCWPRYLMVLEFCSDHWDGNYRKCLDHLSERNRRLTRGPKVDGLGINHSPPQNIIKILDQISAKSSFDSLSDACLKVTDDQDLIVSTILEWSTTLYRSRVDRTYLGIRLLRQWTRLGVQLESSIFTFLGRYDLATGFTKADISRLITELARSRDFSISKYLQWLMARGCQSSSNPANYLPSMLLLELPLFDLPPHVRSLRQILLKKTNYSASEEQQTIVAVKYKLVAMLPDLLVANDPFPPTSIIIDSLASLRGTIRSEISRWIRQSFVSRLQRGSSGQPIKVLDGLGPKSLTVTELEIVCGVLEELEELSMLADVLWLVSDSNDRPLLSTIALTLNYHFGIFNAIGVASEIFQKLYSSSLKTLGRTSSNTPLLLSLVDLGERLPSTKKELRRLHEEIALCEPKPVLAACSPVSDHVTEVLHSAESTFIEEMEILLSSGNSMDKQTLSRIFATITNRLKKVWGDGSQSTADFYNLLTRLRVFNQKAFDTLLQGWLESTLMMNSRPRLMTIITPLVCSATMRLQSFVDRSALYLSTVKEPAACSKLAVEILSLFISRPLDSDELSFNRIYRYSTAIEDAMRDCPASLTFIIGTTLDANAHQKQHVQCIACQLISTPGFLSIMQTILLHYEPAVTELQEYIVDSTSHDSVGDLSNRLLDSTMKEEVTQPRILHEIRRILDIANDFNVVFVRLKLLALLNSMLEGQQDPEVTSPEVFATMIKGLLSSTKTQPDTWVSLVSRLPRKHALFFHEQATSVTLTHIASEVPTTEDTNFTVEQRSFTGDVLLSMLDTVERQIPDDAPMALLSKLKDKLGSLQLEVTRTILQSHDDGDNRSVKKAQVDVVLSHVKIIIRLIVIHQNRLRQPNVPLTLLSQILVDLSLLMINPTLNCYPTLVTDIFDAIAVLSDSLTFESRLLCIYTIRDQHQLRDPRLQFLIGYSNDIEGDRLHLVTNVSPSTSTFTPNSNFYNANKPNTTASIPLSLRKWEMVQDATPMVGENDTSLSLSLFGARKAIL